MAADISNYSEVTCSIPNKHVAPRTGKVPCELSVRITILTHSIYSYSQTYISIQDKIVHILNFALDHNIVIFVISG
jgi:hypothetical protein